MIPATSTPVRLFASTAIALHARGIGRPWRVEEMTTLLEASGFAPVTRATVYAEVHRRPERYRKLRPGVYEAVQA